MDLEVMTPLASIRPPHPSSDLLFLPGAGGGSYGGKAAASGEGPAEPSLWRSLAGDGHRERGVFSEAEGRSHSLKPRASALNAPRRADTGAQRLLPGRT